MKNILFSKCFKKMCVLVWITSLTGSCSTIFPIEEPLLKELQAECTGEGISVKLLFKKPFGGVAYSNGHYETAACRYIVHHEHPLVGSTSGTNFSFLIPINGCGTIYHGGLGSSIKSKDETPVDKNNDNQMYIENTLLIQNDPTIQEAGDVAKTLRCVWQKEFHRPLIASLQPIGKENNVSKMDKYAGRLKTIIAKLDKSHIYQDRAALVNLRFQKRGDVKSVPLHERRHHSRALDFDEDVKNVNSTKLIKVTLKDNEDPIDALALRGSGSYSNSNHINAFSLMAMNMVLIFYLQ